MPPTWTDHINTVWQGDCLELMKTMPDKCVSLCLTDPPYGTTQCAWDEVFPLEILWKELKRIVIDDGAIVITASQPFTAKVVVSNIDQFRYSWIWDKGLSGNIFLAKHQPM